MITIPRWLFYALVAAADGFLIIVAWLGPRIRRHIEGSQR